MSRPFKCRKILNEPLNNYFKPAGKAMCGLQQVCLSLDEFEAIRLADYENMYHELASKKMGVSRQTFGNIVKSARKKVADALINSKALKIHGGYVEKDDLSLRCHKCFKLLDRENQNPQCPECGININKSTGNN